MNVFKGLGKWYWGWIGFLLSVVGAIPAFLIFKSVTVRDWVLLALIVVLGLAVVYLFLYIRHKEKAESLVKIPEAPKPTQEILFVLRALADNPHGYSSRGDLHNLYEQEFQRSEADEFAAVIGTLLGSKLIRYSEPPINQEGIHLTNEGGKYYLDHKERPKKK